MITQVLSLNKYNAAYSNMPVIFSSDNVNKPNFNYLVNIGYNAFEVLSMVSYTVLSNVYTQVEVVAHKFLKGQSILIFAGQYKGIYIVKEVLDVDNIVIDLLLEQPFVYDGLTYMCNFIPYRKSPSPNLNCELDISDSIKDFVKSNILETNDIIDGSSTRFEFFLTAGEEYKYEFSFYDNAFIGGAVAFYNPGITQSSEILFNIGDQIQIEQDTYVWDYSDNIFTGSVGFTSSTAHPFLEGDTITITGQVTNPSYNGVTTITEVLSPTSISTAKTWVSSTPTEGGFIYANIPSEYNTTAVITNIYIDPILGAVIVTNLTFARSTPPIGGVIRPISQFSFRDYNFLEPNTSFAYDIRYDRLDYIKYGGYSPDITGDNYIVGSSASRISTIINNSDYNINYFINYNRVEYNSKSHLLVHSDSGSIRLGFKYVFYASEADLFSGSSLGVSYLYEDDDIRPDLYFPVGVKQLINNVNRIDVGSFDLGSEYLGIKYYTVNVIDSVTSDDISSKIYYKINDDCNRGLPTFNLMWKDANGSWITYPFKYVARKSTSVERSNYYRSEGVFTNDSFNLTTMDRGESTFYVKGRDSVQLSSGWVKEYENKLFEDLILSSEVYLQTPDTSDVVLVDGEFLVDELGNYITDEFGNYIIVGSDSYFELMSMNGYLLPVTLETKNITYGTDGVDSIFNYEPLVKYSFNNLRF